MTHRIVVLGAGFGGLEFCKRVSASGCQVTLVDRQNHHLFQPLLYQVATAGLSAPEIAQPIRSILRDHANVRVLMDEVVNIDPAGKVVECKMHRLEYDTLVVALGARSAYFGNNHWAQHTLGLKTLSEAVKIRTRALEAFEEAESIEDPARRAALMTLVVIGGGPTGVEMAGAFAELTRVVLKRDFRSIDPSKAHVILIEGGDRVLGGMDPGLSEKARQTLVKMGVDVRVSTRVTDIQAEKVIIGTTEIPAHTIVWAAGVSASAITASLGAPMDRGGRVQVLPDLSVPGRPEIFCLGDLVSVMGPDGKPVPGVAPAAIQMGQHVAKLVNEQLKNGVKEPAARAAFKYFDKGTMATIGRSAAVAQAGKIKMSGFLAWAGWLFIHLLFLVGFRNKIAVVWQWVYGYFTYKRGARIIWRKVEE
jgi:NADH:ubiquinone reductase (H+-translocating)